MVILIVLVLLWTPYVIMKLLRRRDARARRPTRPEQVYPQPAVPGDENGGHSGSAWSALDDRQLTRLLTDFAPRNPTE